MPSLLVGEADGEVALLHRLEHLDELLDLRRCSTGESGPTPRWHPSCRGRASRWPCVRSRPCPCGRSERGRSSRGSGAARAARGARGSAADCRLSVDSSRATGLREPRFERGQLREHPAAFPCPRRSPGARRCPRSPGIRSCGRCLRMLCPMRRDRLEIRLRQRLRGWSRRRARGADEPWEQLASPPPSAPGRSPEALSLGAHAPSSRTRGSAGLARPVLAVQRPPIHAEDLRGQCLVSPRSLMTRRM